MPLADDPAEFTISSRALLKNFIPSPVSVRTPFMARTSLNSSTIFSLLPPVLVMISVSIPAKPLDVSSVRLKLRPRLLAASAASFDGEMMVVMTFLTAVIASGVCMPFAVRVAIAADNVLEGHSGVGRDADDLPHALAEFVDGLLADQGGLEENVIQAAHDPSS